MILVLILLILKFLNETNAATTVIKECHNGGVEMEVQGQISRRPLPSASACRDNDQNGLCNALFANNDPNDLANNANPYAIFINSDILQNRFRMI